jgi:hypothetical protein
MTLRLERPVVTGQPTKRAPFEPLVPGVAFAKLNDVESLVSPASVCEARNACEPYPSWTVADHCPIDVTTAVPSAVAPSNTVTVAPVGGAWELP